MKLFCFWDCVVEIKVILEFWRFIFIEKLFKCFFNCFDKLSVWILEFVWYLIDIINLNILLLVIFIVIGIYGEMIL